MPKYTYEAHTPHGLITRKSHREYTHAVAYISSTGQIHETTFCGSQELALKAQSRINNDNKAGLGQAKIFPLTKK